MKLNEFKAMAMKKGSMYDNSQKAAIEWSRTWGLSWWRSLWRYKEYTYNGYTYRAGNVFTRHTHYRMTEYAKGVESISRSAFLKAISAMEYQGYTCLEVSTAKPVQMNLAF